MVYFLVHILLDAIFYAALFMVYCRVVCISFRIRIRVRFYCLHYVFHLSWNWIRISLLYGCHSFSVFTAFAFLDLTCSNWIISDCFGYPICPAIKAGKSENENEKSSGEKNPPTFKQQKLDADNQDIMRACLKLMNSFFFIDSDSVAASSVLMTEYECNIHVLPRCDCDCDVDCDCSRATLPPPLCAKTNVCFWFQIRFSFTKPIYSPY